VTLDELASRSGHAVPVIEFVLGEELAQGRVTRDASGSYVLVRAAFEPKLLTALACL
jgi:hypothetical protein